MLPLFMAYIVYCYKDEEQGRLKLEGPVLIGRSPECDISIRDILLSRRHCRIEAVAGQWVVTDLSSKNGTHIHGQTITRHTLEEGETIRMGRSTLRFYSGEFVPGPPRKPSTSQRPADPFEALSGTVSGFEFQPRGPIRNTDKLPTPQPGPQEPASYEAEKVRGLVSELVSSSWDSIYEEARRREAEAPQSPLVDALRKKRLRDPHVDLALQVGQEKSESDRQKKLSPEAGESKSGVLDAPPKKGRIRAFFRRIGRLF